MQIRRSRPEDLPRLLEIYEYARAFMAAHGNPDQWGKNQWPPEALVRRDTEEKGYVCEHEGRIVGAFFFDYGEDIEPTYRCVEGGAWADESAYGVIHRIAGDGSVPGIGESCISWAFERCGHIRIDTHGDNYVMQNLLKKLGFSYRGIIYVEQDPAPRLAFEKSRGS